MNKTEFIVVTSILLVLCTGLGLFDFVYRITFGWLLFLMRTLPQVQMNWLEVGLSVGSLVLFTTCLHLCLKHHFKVRTTSILPWKLSWTLMSSAGVVLMFAAGIALVGIVHQVVWLVNSPDDIIVSAFHRTSRRLQSLNQQRNIGLAIHAYATTHKGRIPEGGTFLSNGEPRHGWATQRLPYLDQQTLHERIDHEARWDAKKNREHFAVPIQVYQSPGMTKAEQTTNGYATIGYAANSHVMGTNHSMKSFAQMEVPIR